MYQFQYMLYCVHSSVGSQPTSSTSLSEQNLFKTKLVAAFCTRCSFFWGKAGREYVTVSLKFSFESTRLWAREFLVSCGVIFFILRKVASVL